MLDPLPFPERVEADGLTLRLARDGDAELIAGWTRAPEVHRFWGGRPRTVEEVLARYTGRRVPGVVSYVVCDDGRPVGYAQGWQHEGRFGLDLFVAAAEQGRGVGPRAARALATALAARGWTPLTADPAVDNVRAVSAWRAAGFVPTGERGEDGGRPTVLMAFAGGPAPAPPRRGPAPRR